MGEESMKIALPQRELTRFEIDEKVFKYFVPDNYQFPTEIEHRVDPYSSRILYALIREYQPTSCLEIGTSHGGLTCVIQAALLKNGKRFKYVASEMAPDLLTEATNWVTMVGKGVIPTMVGRIEKNLKHVPRKLDFFFQDTDHDLDNCLWYIKRIFPRLRPGALVGIHDWSVRYIDGKLTYEGGSFPEIQHLVKLIEKNELPLQKLFWTWDHEDLRPSIATSFWRYTG